MNRIVVFSGPSVSPDDRKEFDFCFLPPARQGDILACLSTKPTAIGLIDGYFGSTLCVHQKEILEALHCGVPVFGAASMGALRAAELSPYGMVGVGGIYLEYQNSIIESDADVAVTHAPEELGFAATTISLVDLRATIDLLIEKQIYPEQVLLSILFAGESLHFTERTPEKISELCDNIDSIKFDVRSVLKSNLVERKRSDALELIRLLNCGKFNKPSSILAPPRTQEYKRIWQRAKLHRGV